MAMLNNQRVTRKPSVNRHKNPLRLKCSFYTFSTEMHMNSLFLGLAWFWRPQNHQSCFGAFPTAARCHAAQFADVEDAACGLEAFRRVAQVRKELGDPWPFNKTNGHHFPTVITVSGWWFGTFFIFHYIWDNPSHWLSYFSGGLKPPEDGATHKRLVPVGTSCPNRLCWYDIFRGFQSHGSPEATESCRTFPCKPMDQLRGSSTK